MGRNDGREGGEAARKVDDLRQPCVRRDYRDLLPGRLLVDVESGRRGYVQWPILFSKEPPGTDPSEQYQVCIWIRQVDCMLMRP